MGRGRHQRPLDKTVVVQGAVNFVAREQERMFQDHATGARRRYRRRRPLVLRRNVADRIDEWVRWGA